MCMQVLRLRGHTFSLELQVAKDDDQELYYKIIMTVTRGKFPVRVRWNTQLLTQDRNYPERLAGCQSSETFRTFGSTSEIIFRKRHLTRLPDVSTITIVLTITEITH